MSIRFQADNDLKRIIVDATLRREPSIDFQTALATGLHGLDDELVLGRASEQGRILVSHDKRTMPPYWRSSSVEAVRVLVSCWSFHRTHRSAKLLKP